MIQLRTRKDDKAQWHIWKHATFASIQTARAFADRMSVFEVAIYIGDTLRLYRFGFTGAWEAFNE